MWEPVLMLRGETVVTPNPFADHPAVLESIFISELEAPGCLGNKVTFRSSGRRRQHTPLLGVVLVLDDADCAVASKNRVRNVVDRTDAFGSGRRHDVFRVDLHAVQHFVLPLAILEKRERGAIHSCSKAGNLAFDGRHPPMHEPHGQNGGRAIGDGPVFPYRAQNNDAANEKDNNKLKERELAAGPTAQDTHHEQEKQVPKYSVNDGGQGGFLKGRRRLWRGPALRRQRRS